MRSLILISGAALVLLLGACSGEDAKQSERTAPTSDGGSSLNVNTETGSVSYQTDDGTNSTSITVGGDEDEQKKPD